MKTKIMNLNRSALSFVALAVILASCSSPNDIQAVNRSNTADIKQADSRLKITPPDTNGKNEKITVDIGKGIQTGASIALSLDLEGGKFKTSANKNGNLAFPVNSLKSIQVWLVELNTGSSPVNGNPSITPVTGSVFSYDNISTTPTVTFTNVPQNGTGPQKSYYVAVAAYKDNIAGSFFGLANQPLAANITNTTTASGRVMINGTTPAIISDGGGDASLSLTARAGSVIVGNPPNYTVSSTTALTLALKLGDAAGATVEADIKPVDGSITAGAPNLNNLSGTIETIAGTGSPGSFGDGGSPTLALFNAPVGVVVDSNNNIFISDSTNCTIREIRSSNGKIGIAAGMDGVCGNNGDGSAISSKLNSPNGLAVDNANNIYVADTNNHVIRKFTPGGNITTIAGTLGVAGGLGDNGPATSATLNSPLGVVFNPVNGKTYIADTGNHVIREIGIGGPPPIKLFAGTYVQANGADGGDPTLTNLNNPTGIAVDRTGHVYFSDLGNAIIRKVSGGFIFRVAGNAAHSGGFTPDGAQATAAALNYPEGIALDKNDNLFIVETNNNLIRKVSSTTGVIKTYAGITAGGGYNGDGIPATSAKVYDPIGVFMDNFGNLYIADTSNLRVRRVR
jgi:sugar lactone lactonase YvrE